MSWGQVFVQITSNVLLIALVAAIIKFRFDRHIEALKAESRKREQAALVAPLLAKWIANGSNPDFNREEMNRLNWEAVLWLPEDIVRELQKRFINAADAKDPKEILRGARHVIQGEEPKMKAGEYVHF